MTLPSARLAAAWRQICARLADDGERSSPWARVPALERIEDRALPSSGAGFLSGTVLASSGGTSAPMPGVTVELFKVGSSGTITGSSPLATTLSDTSGRYTFTGLAAGIYRIVEVAPSGYTAGASRVSSQLNPALPAGAGAIQVQVVEPSSVYATSRGVNLNNSLAMEVSVNGVTRLNQTGQLNVALGTYPGSTNLNSGYLALCVNDLQTITSTGGEQFQVVPRPITQLTGGTGVISPDHAGRIAYLYNQHASSSLDAVHAAGLQMAVWELLYDGGNTPDFHAGNFQVLGTNGSTTTTQLNQAIAQATSYFNESAGKSASAVFLEAVGKSDASGMQSILASDGLDLTLETSCCNLENISYVINGGRPVSTLANNVRPGDCVKATFTVPAGCTETISLVSYRSPYGPCDPRFASGERIYQYDTRTFGPGVHTLKVKVPNDNFEVDLVCGKPLCRIVPATGRTYEAQGRLIDGAIGSKYPCARPIPQPQRSLTTSATAAPVRLAARLTR